MNVGSDNGNDDGDGGKIVFHKWQYQMGAQDPLSRF